MSPGATKVTTDKRVKPATVHSAPTAPRRVLRYLECVPPVFLKSSIGPLPELWRAESGRTAGFVPHAG